MLIIILFLIAIIFYDWEWRRIPHVLTLGGSTIAWIVIDYLPAQTITNALMGSAVIFLFLLAIRTIGRFVYHRTVLGFGDVMLGWFIGNIAGVVEGLYAIAFGMLLAGVYSLIGLWQKKLTIQSSIPYGVFLSMAMLIVLAFSFFS